MLRKINVALVDVDNTDKVKFPNLVLMKASNYYKSNDYNVKLIHGKLLNKYNEEYKKGIPGSEHNIFFPDIVIKSKVFTWTEDKNLFCTNSDNYQFGGTGYGIKHITKIIAPEIDRGYPDYNLYKGLYNNKSKKFEDAGIGFITRGCIRNCDFCFVPKKEGRIRQYMYVEDCADVPRNGG